jgi:hypothetical protein
MVSADRSHPAPVRRAILANLLGAGFIACLYLSGYLYFRPDFELWWQVVVGLAVWVLGTTGLWWGRRWGWYATLTAATVVSLIALLIGVGLFHETPTLRRLVNNPAIVLILGASLVPWVMVVMLCHPVVRQFVRQPRPAGDSGFLPRHIGRPMTVLALVALLPAAWLASRPVYAHRSLVDDTEAAYTSNYLRARGLLFPWIVTEVPADVAIHWPQRVFPMNFLALYLVAAAPLLALYMAMVAVQTARREKGPLPGDDRF